jgi:hypothetical protein
MALSKEKNYYPPAVKQATVRLIQSSPEWIERGSGKRMRLSSKLMSQARVVANGATSKVIHLWLNTDISEDLEKERLSRRGRKAALSESFKKILVGRAIDHRMEFSAVSSENLIEFSLGSFNYIIKQQRVSEILNDYGFSSQLSVPRNSRMVDDQVVEDCIEFIMELRKHRKYFRRLLAMDETGLWSNVVKRLTYHFRNQYDIRKLHILPQTQLAPPNRYIRNLLVILTILIQIII